MKNDLLTREEEHAQLQNDKETCTDIQNELLKRLDGLRRNEDDLIENQKVIEREIDAFTQENKRISREIQERDALAEHLR